MEIIALIIILLSMINLIRLATLMLGADIYEARQYGRSRQPSGPRRPRIAVIIPAHNEEAGICRTLDSVLANDYPSKHIIVVNDGSTDGTARLLRDFKKANPTAPLTILRQRNQGKATAVNTGLRHQSIRSSLVMVLDADSILHPQAITRMVQHFRDSRVVAAAANVKIIENKGWLVLAQRLEYVISHRIKRGLTTYNMEYIIGGVGSTFRRKMIKHCDYYDTDTMTEDIDFTLKLIAKSGNRRHKLIFAADVIAYTEGVMRLGSLVRQRFRWKFGRMQTFVKHRELFFSRNAKYDRRLTWLYMPFVVWSEAILLLEPLLTGIILASCILAGGLSSFVPAYGFVTLFCAIAMLGESTETWRSRFGLIIRAPLAYPLLIVLSLVDFVALMQSLVRFRQLFYTSNTHSSWQSPERIGTQPP